MPVLEKSVCPVLEDFHRELDKIEAKGEFRSLHEAYGILLEEVDEFWDEVKKKPQNRDKQNIVKELIQIAAISIKAIKSLKLKI